MSLLDSWTVGQLRQFLNQFAVEAKLHIGAATNYQLLVLIGKIVESHLAEEELLTLVLDIHC